MEIQSKTARTYRVGVAALFVFAGVLNFVLGRTYPALLFVVAGILTGVPAFVERTPTKP
jgi:hypothetical protein